MRSKHDIDAGYTLTELLVVIVVLALIAAAVTPQILGRFNTAKTRTAQLQTNTLAGALDDFFIDVGRYPHTRRRRRCTFESACGCQRVERPIRSLRTNAHRSLGAEIPHRTADREQSTAPYRLAGRERGGRWGRPGR